MKNYSFEYVIDISGQPFEDMYLGMCSYLPENKTYLLKEFNDKFPRLKRKRYKGSTLKENELYNIMKFLNEKKVHMTVLHLKSKYLHRLKKTYLEEYNYTEKIIGAAYFTLLQSKAKPFFDHSVTVDDDSFMDVRYALKICRKISKANNYRLSLTVAHSTYNDFISLSDYVASFKRKVRGNKIKNLERYKALTSKIPKEFLTKAFD